MDKLITELNRLYKPHDGAPGATRALVIRFRKLANGAQDSHWQLLCKVANSLQTELGLPAPAVSISGADGYGLWLSLENPVPLALAHHFLTQLQAAFFPDMPLAPDAHATPAQLPPFLHAASGKWAAFIHPGLGASFADEAGLEMAPPAAGQLALLEGLTSISDAQFASAMRALQPPAAIAPAAAAAPAGATLLLKDATLEDIVRHLHAMNIEPTFRHRLKD
jgi:hypothetical protein